jgi:hypothetical protein
MSAFLEISTMGSCVNKCKYCPYELYKNSYVSDIKKLSLENFKIAIDKLPANSVISFAAFNEPFQNQECADMILYAYSKGHQVWVFSTLIGLDINQYKKLHNVQFGYFSLHLPDSEGYTVVPISQKYLDTLQYVINNPPKGTLIIHHHGGELHDAIKYIVPSSSILTPHDRSGNLQNDDSRIIKHEYNSGYIKCGHTFLFNFNEGSGVLLCDGSIALCCSDFGLKHILGNLFTQSWQEIMQGEEMKKVIKGLSDESIDILCRKCAIARSANQ